MAHKYAQIAFTETVRQVQSEQNSRAGYARMDEGEDYNYLLSEYEAEFIAERDSFYMASVGETGWPYVQHRGGPKGFMQVLDASTLGFADFSGNRQYVSTGNFRTNNRVSIFFMDYPNKRRLKLMGRVELVKDDDWETQAKLEVAGYRAEIERTFIIKIEAFDWNCPQHITPRFTEAEMEQLIAPVIEENVRLKAQSDKAQPTYPQSLGDGPITLTISGIRQLTPRVRAYELRHPQGLELPQFEAGAHLQIPVQLEDGSLTTRHYSICSNPARRDIYEIAVLHEEQGQGGSVAVHQYFNLGMTLKCQPPQNYFKLHEDTRPTILIAGGIGITPIKAMAQKLRDQGRKFELHYAGRSQLEMAFFDRLQREFVGNGFFYRGDANERIDLHQILSTKAPDAVVYACGPQKLLTGLKQQAQLLEVDPQQIQLEQFGASKQAHDGSISLELARSGKVVEVSAEQTLLDAIIESGIDIPNSCKSGVCKSCAVTVLDGEPDHRDQCLTQNEQQVQKQICPCVSRSVSDSLVLDI